MVKVRLSATTLKSFDEFRSDLDSAIESSFAGALMQRTWTERTVRTVGPATEGFIRFEPPGVYAEFQISWPATGAQDIIEESRRILAQASGGTVRRLE